MLPEVQQGFSENIPNFYVPYVPEAQQDEMPIDESFILDTDLQLNDMDEDDVAAQHVRRRMQPTRPEQIDTSIRNALPDEAAPNNFRPYKDDVSLLPFYISPKTSDKPANINDFIHRHDKAPEYDNEDISDFVRRPDVSPLDKGNEDTHKFTPALDKNPTNKRYVGGTTAQVGSNRDVYVLYKALKQILATE